jgi:membrane protease YdiL (CAAX protease family)
MRSPAEVQPIAPLWHTCGLLALLAAISALSIYTRMESATPRISHLRSYLIVIAFEWTLFAFTMWRSDIAFTGYVARVLRNPRSLLWDIPVTLLLCAVLLFAVTPLVTRLLGPGGWVSSAGIVPHGAAEIALWFVVCITAGICEETVFRGYLQQQFSAWTGNAFVGVFIQAVIFGLCHSYQGWKNTALISVWGFVFGAFVWWRKGLRANMIAHTLLDSLAAF